MLLLRPPLLRLVHLRLVPEVLILSSLKSILIAVCLMGPPYQCIHESPALRVEGRACHLGTFKGEVFKDGSWVPGRLKITCEGKH
jgi:hypothetical protein